MTTRQTSGTSNFLLGVSFVNADAGTAVGDYGTWVTVALASELVSSPLLFLHRRPTLLLEQNAAHISQISSPPLYLGG